MYDPIIYFDDMRTDDALLVEIRKEYPQLIGLPEVWKPVTSNVVKDVKPNAYYISSYGRSYSISRHKLMTPVLVSEENGYYRIYMYDVNGNGKYYLLHRLVLIMFEPLYFPNYENLQVNHKDGDKSHNWYWNLEWVTAYENIHHAINNGLRNMNGENHPNCHITESDADCIGYLLTTTNMTAKEIAEYIGNGVTEGIVFNIMNGSAWRNIYDKYNLSSINRNPSVLDENKINSICKYFELNKRYGITLNEYLSCALNYLNIDINDSTLRLAMRLYYKLTHKNICSKYNY